MTSKSKHYKRLKNKWVKKHLKVQKKLWDKHGYALSWIKNASRQFVVTSAAGLLLLTSPITANVLSQLPHNTNPLKETHIDKKDLMKVALSNIVPQKVAPLTPEQERSASQVLTQAFNIPVSAELDGKRLNRSYGYIGKEQHLMRYPGDTIETHFDTPEEMMFADSGMAPGRGAWGYFTSSRAAMTEQDKLNEKYYIAVQTFLSPGWNEDPNSLYKFFKFRKMLVVNPENGKAVVVVIGDAGPAEFTKKSLGGSPEVMAYLERVDGAQKGPVLYFFIDDPEDKVPLGPIDVK